MIVDNEFIELRKSLLGGEGLFAKKNIPKGTQILREEHISCVRNFTSSVPQLNSYFDFPKIVPTNEINTDLPLLGAIIDKLDEINQKYGNNWHEHLYKADYDKFHQKLTVNERRYISTLCLKYPTVGGYKLIASIYNSIIHNCFKTIASYNMSTVYYALDYVTSKFNHSCQQNCRNLIFPKHATTVTDKDISKGSELTINYGLQFLKHNNIKCKCGGCNKKSNSVQNKFSVDMCKREFLNERHKTALNISMEIPKYLKNENADKYMQFGGIEVWYHLLYEVRRRMEILRENPIAVITTLKQNPTLIYTSILPIHYIRAMMKDLSKRNEIEEEEILMYFLITINIPAMLIPVNDNFFSIIKSTKEVNLTFDCDKDLKVLSTAK